MRHTSPTLKKAGRTLSSKTSTKKEKSKAAKVLNKHKQKMHKNK